MLGTPSPGLLLATDRPFSIGSIGRIGQFSVDLTSV